MYPLSYVTVKVHKQWKSLGKAVALDPGADPALRSFHDEGVRSLAASSAYRRVMAAATAP
jgi:hypothetical protein